MKLAVAVTAALLLSGCHREPSSTASPQDGAAGQEWRIDEGTQARIGTDLEIGAGNFWEEEGRLTCGLWILDHSASPPPPQEHLRVHQGQVLERGRRRIEVVDVTRKDGKGAVVLRVAGP